MFLYKTNSWCLENLLIFFISCCIGLYLGGEAGVDEVLLVEAGGESLDPDEILLIDGEVGEHHLEIQEPLNITKTNFLFVLIFIFNFTLLLGSDKKQKMCKFGISDSIQKLELFLVIQDTSLV